MGRQTHPYFKLRDEFRREMDSTNGWPTQRDLFKDLRAQGGHGTESDYTRLMAGEPAPEPLVNALARWARREVGEIADPAEPPPKKASPDAASDIRLKGWEQLLVTLLGGKRRLPSPGAYLKGDGDFAKATRIIYECAGKHQKRNHASLSPDELMRAGTEAMVIDPAEFQEVLKRWAEADPRTVMYCESHRYRVGVVSVLPLTESAYTRLKEGELADTDIRKEDISPVSNLLYFAAFAEINEPKPISIAIAQLCTMAFQIASFAASRDIRDLRFLAPDATVENEKRLLAYGFEHTWKKMPKYDFRIMELDLSKPRSRGDMFYVAVNAIVNGFWILDKVCKPPSDRRE